MFRTLQLFLPCAIFIMGVFADPTLTTSPACTLHLFTGAVNTPNTCDNIDHCRTLSSIVQSCLVTILACIWFGVHRNIPAPFIQRGYHRSPIISSLQFLWNKVLDQKEAATIFFTALLAPEFILGWAVRQALTAWRLTRKLEEARLHAGGDIWVSPENTLMSRVMSWIHRTCLQHTQNFPENLRPPTRPNFAPPSTELPRHSAVETFEKRERELSHLDSDCRSCPAHCDMCRSNGVISAWCVLIEFICDQFLEKKVLQEQADVSL